MSQKVKEMLSPLKPTKHRLIFLVVWFFYGIIIDLLLEMLVWYTSDNKGWGALEVGFKFYAGHDRTSIPYDDLLIYAVCILLMLTKNFYKGLGLFLGAYISSTMGLYDKLKLPHPEGN